MRLVFNQAPLFLTSTKDLPTAPNIPQAGKISFTAQPALKIKTGKEVSIEKIHIGNPQPQTALRVN